MTNKKSQRTSKRNPRAPIWLDDHVVSSLGHKRNEKEVNVSKKADMNNSTGKTNVTEKDGELERKEIRAHNLEGNEFVEENEANTEGAEGSDSDLKKKDGSVRGMNVETDCSKEGEQSTKNNTQDDVVSTSHSPDSNVSDGNAENEGSIDSERNKETLNNNVNSYAKMVAKDAITVTKKLMFIAPKVKEDGEETVLFDEDIVLKGSVKWQLTICGYFVGKNMMIHELRYHIRRMWSRYGLKEVIVNASGVNLFKFQNESGMNNVLNQGPWMVNNRPLFVQKWNPEIGLLKVEPTKMPLWIKMINIPMEAWSVEGISAMASSLGKPLVRDSVTAHMCQFGVGRADYARVLVEVEAGKQMKSEIKIEYTDMNKCLKGTKVVKVEYDWKPECCSHCKVFGHVVDQCNGRPRTEKEIQDKREAENKVQVVNKPKFQEEFAPVQNRKSNMQQQNRNWQYRSNYNNHQRQEYRKKNGGNDKDKDVVKETATESTSKANNGKSVNVNVNFNRYEALNEGIVENTNPKSYDDEFPAFPMSLNQSGVTNGTTVEDDIRLHVEKKFAFIDKLVDDKRIPNVEESKLWFESPNQLLYYKKKWKVKWKEECPI